MKCSEYLWHYCEMMDEAEGMPPEEVQGRLREQLGGEEITADSNDEVLSEREAKSVFGRNEDRLWEAYKMGSRPLFAAVCMYQQMSDDEWHKAKAEAEAAQECEACQVPEAGGEA